MNRLLSLVTLVCCAGTVWAGPVFDLVQGVPAAKKASVPGPRPEAGSLVRVNGAELARVLEGAPTERVGASLNGYGLAIELPHPSGGMIECFVAASPVMEPALAARFPQMRTYVVQSIDGVAGGRMELTPRGLTAMLRSPDGTWMIDLWQSADPDHVIAYWLKDLRGGEAMVCETVPGVHGPVAEPVDEIDPMVEGGFGERALQTRRTYRLAMACAGEFGLYQCDLAGNPPNVIDPMAAIVTIVARSNVVYEQDMAIHFDLVANNDLLVFTDPATDPYDPSCGGGGGSDCSGPFLGANITLLNEVIGNANFDVGHVLTRIFGGVANLRAVCGNNKAGGVSGMPRGGDIDPVTALVVIHELGHQFGANHTFSGTRGRCFGNVSLNTAYEAGSGSSPMAYAGGCPVGDEPPSDNIVQFADTFFHHGSVREMQTFVDGNGGPCSVAVMSSNSQPVIVSTTASTNIPPSTPFTLWAVATDADGDVLTYSWEQFNNGVARPLSGEGAEDNGSGALFRIFTPVLSPMRTFPQMSDVLSDEPTPGERLPTVTGVSRRFRVIVRDNKPGAGAVAISSFVNLAIEGTPFAVVSPVANQRVDSGPLTVSWTTGGTQNAPFNCSTVRMLLSTDGGATFDTVLGTFANTGSANVTIPALSPGEAYLRIEGVGQIFFNVSREFLVNVPCTADLDHDGDVDSDDIIAFFTGFDLGEADFDLDDDTDSDDIIGFFGAFESGCGG